MIRTIPKIALLVGALAMAGQASAHGGGGWGGPAVLGALVGAAVVGSVVASQPREVYVQQPVYVQPRPYYRAGWGHGPRWDDRRHGHGHRKHGHRGGRGWDDDGRRGHR